MGPGPFFDLGFFSLFLSCWSTTAIECIRFRSFRRPVAVRVLIPRLPAEARDDAPFRRGQVEIGMIDEALEACPMRRDQDPVEIAGRHRISGMRIAASGNPRNHFIVVAHSVESATGLGIYRLGKELLREPHL